MPFPVPLPVIRNNISSDVNLPRFVAARDRERIGARVMACFRMRKPSSLSTVWRTAVRLLPDVLSFIAFGFQSRPRLVAENLFLRKQLALYRERRVKPRCADDATRITLVMLSRLIDWRAVLTIVKPDTLLRWHRQGFRLFWRWKSRSPGRPPLPVNVQQLIAAMARANATWGKERIAAELRLKLGLCVSPRTVRRYMRQGERPRDRLSSQHFVSDDVDLIHPEHPPADSECSTSGKSAVASQVHHFFERRVDHFRSGTSIAWGMAQFEVCPIVS